MEIGHGYKLQGFERGLVISYAVVSGISFLCLLLAASFAATIYIPPVGFDHSYIVVAIAGSAALSLILALRRIAKASEAGWFEILSSLPLNLLVSLFVWEGLRSLLAVIVIETGQPATQPLHVWSSHWEAHCRTRVDFDIAQGSSFVCTDRRLSPETYSVQVRSSAFGIVIVTPPEKWSLAGAEPR